MTRDKVGVYTHHTTLYPRAPPLSKYLSDLLGSASASLPFYALAFIKAIAWWQTGGLILVQTILFDVVYDRVRQEISDRKTSSQEEANLEEKM